MTDLEKIEREALSLPEAQRAFLADRLLSSLDAEVLDDIDASWIAEAERRYADFKAGGRKPIPADEVFAETDRITKRLTLHSVRKPDRDSLRRLNTTRKA